MLITLTPQFKLAAMLWDYIIYYFWINNFLYQYFRKQEKKTMKTIQMNRMKRYILCYWKNII